jgi:hypothetical protein
MSFHDYSWYQRQGHICGLYYNVPVYHSRLEKTYLPQVGLQAHATILATTSRTVLTQTFVNPSAKKGIREVRYTFPLYDGVSVVGFTCHVGEREIIGEVKEKEKARAVFKDAVARGETAGLFEQLPEASDVFTTTVGNLPPGARVVIKITYLGELKHDMEVDGIRYTIPNIICPRYGSTSANLHSSADAPGISITVDADMADGSFIQKIQSPTHPISMTIGTTSLAPDADPMMTKASATLALGTAELDKDFVLQVIAKNTGVPKAILENHPSIPNHRALMATLVPKFALPPEKPELVFVCDRSGSMGGSRITLVIQALKVFLKSLPIGVKFNICSFGSSYSFLWKKSVTYSQTTLDEAIRHAEDFQANYGGTEMLEPLKATIDQRYKDMPLDVMLLTDGETWNQEALFSYLNDSVTASKAPIRLFTLGIGNGVSHALIEGIAKAGNGFSQSVGEGEKMDTKVVRMLKGALSPHVNDYTLEVKYANATLDEEDDDFEIVEKVADSLKVKLTVSEEDPKPAVVRSSLNLTNVIWTNHEQKKPISLFDTSADPDKEDSPVHDNSGENKYAHLPKIDAPKIIQAPQNIPSLFAFNRTTVYLLLGPDAPKATPKSVLLCGTSAHGPLELEIPIQVLDQPNETIHQLAAKKAISELEQGRGWLSRAKDDTGALLKTKFEGRYDDIVEREAVRLGVQFQVGGKWCSFVAVESNKRSKDAKVDESENWEYLDDERTACKSSKASNTSRGRVCRAPYSTNPTNTDNTFEPQQQDKSSFSFATRGSPFGRGGRSFSGGGGRDTNALNFRTGGVGGGSRSAAFGSVSSARSMVLEKPNGSWQPPQQAATPFGSQQGQTPSQPSFGSAAPTGGLFGAGSGFSSFQVQQQQQSASLFGSQQAQQQQPSASLFGSQQAQQQQPSASLFGSQQAQQQQPSASLFGSQQAQIPAQPSFGSGAPSGGLFGARSSYSSLQMQQQQQQQQAQQQQQSASLFGSQSTEIFAGSAPKSDPAALQDYQLGLMVLQQQNRNRRTMVPQGNTNTTSDHVTYDMQVDSSRPPAKKLVDFCYVEGDNESMDDIEGDRDGGSTLLEAEGGGFTVDSEQESVPAKSKEKRVQKKTSPFPPPLTSKAQQDADYQMQLMLLDQQCKKRMSSARQEKDKAPSSADSSTPTPMYTGDEGVLENFDFDSFLQGGESDGSSTKKAKLDFSFGTDIETSAGFGSAPQNLESFVTKKTPEELTHHLISLQTFEGSWEVSEALVATLGIDVEAAGRVSNELGADAHVFITAVVVAVFEQRLKAFEGSWELVVEKAKGWLSEQGLGDAEVLIGKAKELVK